MWIKTNSSHCGCTSTRRCCRNSAPTVHSTTARARKPPTPLAVPPLNFNKMNAKGRINFGVHAQQQRRAMRCCGHAVGTLRLTVFVYRYANVWQPHCPVRRISSIGIMQMQIAGDGTHAPSPVQIAFLALLNAAYYEWNKWWWWFEWFVAIHQILVRRSLRGDFVFSPSTPEIYCQRRTETRRIPAILVIEYAINSRTRALCFCFVACDTRVRAL